FMSRDSRIALHLSDLPLESVGKIFTFVEDSLKSGLFDITAFETGIKKINILEQYFTCEYMTIYYSSHKLNLWLKTQKEEWGMDDETARNIQVNWEEFVPALEGMRNSLKRLAQNHKRIHKNFKGLLFSFEEEVIK